MIKEKLTNKPRGLYGKFLLRLWELDESVKINSKRDFIPYSLVFEKLCRNFSMRKQEIRELLFLIGDIGLIELNSKGIKLQYGI